MHALYRAKLSYHNARVVQSKIVKKCLCRSDFFHAALTGNGSISKQSGRARAGIEGLPPSTMDKAGAGVAPLSVSRKYLRPKIERLMIGYKAGARLTFCLARLTGRSAIKVASAASEAPTFWHPSTDPIARRSSQRIEHEAVAAVSMHLLRAPSISSNRATVDRRRYSKPADGPGPQPAANPSCRSTPTLSIAGMRQVVAVIDDRVRHSGRGCILVSRRHGRRPWRVLWAISGRRPSRLR
jgi:hypothetical protein